MAQSTKVTFGTLGSGGCQISGPRGASPVTPTPQWVTDTTANNTRIVYRPTANSLYQWSLDFTDITADEKTALYTFFHMVAKGPENTFAYTHTDGVTRTVRFVNTSLPYDREDSRQRSLKILLESTSDFT